jgi:hypothetical protein
MFKRILAVLVIGFVLVPQAAAQQPTISTGQLTVPRGTVLTFRTLQYLDSATAKVGDDVPLRLECPLVVDGVVLLPAGEAVHGRVTKVKRAGPKGHDGYVYWKLNRIKFADGTTAKSMVGTIGELDGFWDTFWLIVIFSPVLPFYLAHLIFGDDDNKNPRSSAPGEEFSFPANSEVEITIMKNHQVHF